MPSPGAGDEARLRAAIALMSGNPSLLAAADGAGPAAIGDDMHAEVARARAVAPAGPASLLVRAATAMPVVVQWVGQRAALASPRLARAILRRTGLHHQLY